MYTLFVTAAGIYTGNSLTSLPELGGLTALTELAVAGNQLKALPNSLAACTALSFLFANGNRITRLPPGLEALQVGAAGLCH